MTPIIDCHNHSNFSSDAVDSVNDMCLRAVELNMKAFAITDHCDFDGSNLPHCIEKISSSVKATEDFRNSHPSNTEILTGVELGEASDFPDDAKTILELCDYDVVIGSYHNSASGEDFYYVDAKSLSDKEISDLLTAYFNKIYETAKVSGINVLAHITYPLRYIVGNHKRKVDINDYNEIITLILKTIIERGVSLEVNTSGLRQQIAETLPNADILKMYRNLGGELISLGSDSHNTKDLGKGIKETVSLLKSLGFTHITYYKKRKPVQVSIE